MPAQGDGLSILKWVSSFPGNVGTGHPVVDGILCVSDSTTGVPLMLMDARAVTALRTGAAAAVASLALAREDAISVGIIGCGVHGQWAARSLVAAGYKAGICFDTRSEQAEQLATEVGWRSGSIEEALSRDVVCCVTPGTSPVVRAETLRPGQHLNMLGADGPGKAEATLEAVQQCRLFCDEWDQASHGGELTAAVDAGLASRDTVTDLGEVLAGTSAGRKSLQEITLFDSTGLAIQDLAIARAALAAWRAGRVPAQTIKL
jgi:ornithine cyclodeaminase/alanine dehydrogenase-like protein (mu-crystallin family)